MTHRYLLTLAIGLVGVGSAPAGFWADFRAPYLLVDAQNAAGSRFIGNPSYWSWGAAPVGNAASPINGDGSVFRWAAGMRYRDQADFDARSGTAVEFLPETRFDFTVSVHDYETGSSVDLTFGGRASGEMSATASKLNVVFDEPMQSATLDGAPVVVELGVTNYDGAVPWMLFDDGWEAPPGSGDVAGVTATITVKGEPIEVTWPPYLWALGPPPSVETPEPTTLALAGVGLATVALRRRKTK